MISLNTVEKFRSQFADSLEYVELADGRYQVITPLLQSDGDGWGFTLQQKAGGWQISDGGDTIAKASYSGINLLAKGRRERLESLCMYHGIMQRDGELLLDIAENDFGNAFFRFAQAWIDIARLAKLPAEKTPSAKDRSEFKLRIAHIVEEFQDRALVVGNWSHPEYDPHGVYKADYLIAAKEPLLLFEIASDHDSLKAAVSALHYRQQEFNFTGIVVTDESKSLTERSRTVLQDTFSVRFESNRAKELRAYVEQKLIA